MDPKTAFKLGFASTLAEHQVSPEDLVVAAEKVAAADFAGKMAPLSAGLSLALPLGIGHAVGSSTERLLSEELDTPEEVRKKYLIKRLRQLLASEQAKQHNKLVTQALQA